MDPAVQAASRVEQARSVRHGSGAPGAVVAILDLVGFEPRRIVTGCCPAGLRRRRVSSARAVTGKLAAVFTARS